MVNRGVAFIYEANAQCTCTDRYAQSCWYNGTRYLVPPCSGDTSNNKSTAAVLNSGKGSKCDSHVHSSPDLDVLWS